MSEVETIEVGEAIEPLVAVTDRQRKVVRALRSLDGRATVGDVVAAAGIGRDEAEITLRELLGTYRGHVAVGERGDLLYTFDRKLIRRDRESWWSKAKRGLKRFLTGAFKAWIVLMLTVYFVVFVAILLGVMFGGDNRRGGRRGIRVPSFWIWYLFWTRDWRYGRPYYGHRWEARRGEKVPFYKKVFAFVFGPDTPLVTTEDRDRDALAIVRSRRGVITAAEFVEYTGLSLERASDELSRLMVRYDGDVRVSSGGTLAWVFPELMVSAHGRVRVREPEPAWRRLESGRVLTGNSSTSNAIIGSMNGFNLLAAATAPWTFLGTTAPPIAYVGLVAIPFTFSSIFFAIPLYRRWRLARDNRRRHERNIRKALLSIVFQSAVEQSAVSVRGATMWVQHALADDSVSEAEVEVALNQLAAEFDAGVDAGDHGLRFRFPSIRDQLAGGEEVRDALKLETRRVGAIVYSSGDTASEASHRDLASFDAELRRSLPTPGRAAFVDDFEVIQGADAMRR